MLLAATALTEFWGDGAILRLGPWCKSERGRRAPDPWADRARLHAACGGAQELLERLLPELGAGLSALHGEKLPPEYWKVLLAPWLSRFIHLVWDRYERLRLAFEAEPGLDAVLLDEADFTTARGLQHFQDLGFSDEYNLQIISQLIDLQRQDFPRRCLTRPAPEFPDRTRPCGARALDAAVRAASPRILVAELFPRRAQNVRLLARLAGKAGPFLGALPPPPAADLARRAKLTIARKGAGPEAAVRALLARHVPTLYVEGFATARAATRSGWRRAPDVLVSSTGWLFDEAFKFAAAEFSLSGTTRVGWQHGGGYGVDLDTPTESLERLLVDRFVTWGWTSDAPGAKTVPLPNPHIEDFRARGLSAGPRRDLLFVTNGFPLFPYLLYNWPIGWQVEDDFERQRRFILALPEAARKALVLRLYPLERGWNARERIESGLPAMRRDNSGSMAGALSRAKLAVFDHVGTSFSEALAHGTPTMALRNPAVSPFRPEAEPLAARLKEAGLLYDSPDEAAKAAARLLPDVTTWWEGAAARGAREAWLTSHGRSGDWSAPWADFLNGLIRAAASS